MRVQTEERELKRVVIDGTGRAAVRAYVITTHRVLADDVDQGLIDVIRLWDVANATPVSSWSPYRQQETHSVTVHLTAWAVSLVDRRHKEREEEHRRVLLWCNDANESYDLASTITEHVRLARAVSGFRWYRARTVATRAMELVLLFIGLELRASARYGD